MSEEYLSAGYYLAQPSMRAEYMSPDLIPDRVLSASRCICKFFPDDWAIEWTSVSHEERSKAANSFGIAHKHLSRATQWATENFSKAYGWPSAFYTLEAAEQARAILLPPGADVVFLGLGLHEADLADFLEVAKPAGASEGCAPVGESGIYQCIKANTRIASGGKFAGFELLSTAYSLLTCSWLCNGLENECARTLGICPNENGLIHTRPEALRCVEFISGGEVGAEPGLWQPWRVTIYTKP